MKLVPFIHVKYLIKMILCYDNAGARFYYLAHLKVFELADSVYSDITVVILKVLLGMISL